MAEGNEHSGKSFGGRKSYGHGGSGRPGNRGGKGFKPRGKGGYGHRDGDREGGKGGFGGRKSYGKGGYRKDRDFHKDGERRGGYRDNRGGKGGFGKGPRRDGEHGGNPRYRRDDDRRNNRRNDEHGERRQFSDDEKREYREHKRTEYMSRPRRNSDGTMSFPSQNPYTARRPDEPVMPKGLEWSMLSSDEKERLRGLAKEHAENTGLHILAAYALIDDDPKAAMEHAKWVARQASRIDFARETLAFAAYRTGDYKLALREFRTAYRMNGFLDYLPFIADCERGVGEPKKAVELALSDEGKQLHGAPKVEMFLVYAGALGDLEMWDKAIEVVHTVGRSQGLPGEYRMRAVQAEQYFLEEAGRSKEAEQLNDLLDRLEDQYADEEIDENSDDVVIDHDLEDITDDSDVLEKLGIDPDEAQYAPDPEQEYGDEDDEAEDGDAESDEADETETDSANDAEADDSAESADSDSTEPETETEE